RYTVSLPLSGHRVDEMERHHESPLASTREAIEEGLRPRGGHRPQLISTPDVPRIHDREIGDYSKGVRSL
ncbi:MAG TPA: hypothetical protein VI653_15915, partial [Steroidobacteraceae bacterium]